MSKNDLFLHRLNCNTDCLLRIPTSSIFVIVSGIHSSFLSDRQKMLIVDLIPNPKTFVRDRGVVVPIVIDIVFLCHMIR